jgi:hypothetical protein
MLIKALVSLYILAGYFKFISGRLLNIYNEFIGVHINYNEVDNAAERTILPYMID